MYGELTFGYNPYMSFGAPFIPVNSPDNMFFCATPLI